MSTPNESISITQIIELSHDGLPDREQESLHEREFMSAPEARFVSRQVRNVTRPTLTTFLPDPALATGTAVIICPGGAHHVLVLDHEGYSFARWLSERGIAAFVLKYRLVATPERDDVFEAQMNALLREPERLREPAREYAARVRADGQAAIHTVRTRADEWNLDPDRVGILGFSAGGYVAALVSLQEDGPARPNFVASIYGVFWETIQVPEQAPPLFIAFASDDEMGEIITAPCQALWEAWRAAGHPVELHAYASGGHGFGLLRQGLPSDTWADRFHDWLRALGFAPHNGSSETGATPHWACPGPNA